MNYTWAIFRRLPLATQDRLGSHVVKDTFTFLFAKSGPSEAIVSGRAYEIDLEQELSHVSLEYK